MISDVAEVNPISRVKIQEETFSKKAFVYSKGFAFNLLALTWYFLGGVLRFRIHLYFTLTSFQCCSYAYVCNILSVILRANFADPVDTAKDMIERNMTLLGWPGSGEMWKQWLAQHDNPDYNKLAETMIIADTWKEYDKMVEHGILANRTHVFMTGYVSPWEISLGRHPGLSPRMTHKGGEVWYKSKERVDSFPYAGYLSRKDWRFNEVL